MTVIYDYYNLNPRNSPYPTASGSNVNIDKYVIFYEISKSIYVSSKQ